VQPTPPDLKPYSRGLGWAGAAPSARRAGQVTTFRYDKGRIGANARLARRCRATPARCNELVIWIGTNDDCIQTDSAATATAEAQSYLSQQLMVGWKITWIAMVPRDASYCT
jgi:hypothetical protein